MGIKDILFGKRDDATIEYAKALAIQQQNINAATNQQEMEQLLGIKDKVIRDAGAEAIYDSELFFSHIVYNKETGQNEVVPVGPDYAGQARRLFLSPKLSLGNIDKKTAKLHILKADREFINMEMQSKEHQYKLGIGSRYVAQNIHVRTNIIGSIEGKLQRNLTVPMHVTRVEAGEINNKKKGGSSWI